MFKNCRFYTLFIPMLNYPRESAGDIDAQHLDWYYLALLYLPFMFSIGKSTSEDMMFLVKNTHKDRFKYGIKNTYSFPPYKALMKYKTIFIKYEF